MHSYSSTGTRYAAIAGGMARDASAATMAQLLGDMAGSNISSAYASCNPASCRYMSTVSGFGVPGATCNVPSGAVEKLRPRASRRASGVASKRESGVASGLRNMPSQLFPRHGQ